MSSLGEITTDQDQREKDIQIPVPWGHLAAKVWGPENGLPVLALHGWQDNAGTFDKLAPLLPKNIRLVCLDFCGHGFSSHYPLGMFVTHYNYVYHLKLVVDFFQWDKIIIMGHSMGGQIAILFTSIFPEKVHKLISLDALKQYSAPEGDFVRRTRGVFDDFQSIVTKLEQGVPSTVTYSQAREKLVNSYQGSIGEKEADVLLLRSLRKKDEDSFEFTRDLRTIIRPYVFSDFTNEKLKAYAQGITCPFLLILARHSVTSLSLEPKEMHQEFLEIYRRASKDFRLVEVDGTHHVHLTHPDVVAPFICKFLQPGNS